MPRQTPIKADTPVANPSKPSVILAPFETAVIIKITTSMYSTQVYGAHETGNNFE